MKLLYFPFQQRKNVFNYQSIDEYSYHLKPLFDAYNQSGVGINVTYAKILCYFYFSTPSHACIMYAIGRKICSWEIMLIEKFEVNQINGIVEMFSE